MNKRVLKLKIITSMLSHGVSNKLEIRIPAFKGMMRFWWRALGSFKDLNEMKEKEGMLFGDNEKHASPIKMRTNFRKYDRCPNTLGYRKDKKTGDWRPIYIKGIKEGQKVDIVVCKTLPDKGEELDYYINLIELMSVLGGVGQRARRGYGSFYVVGSLPEIKGKDDILKYLQHKMKKLGVIDNFDFCKNSYSIRRKNDNYKLDFIL